MKKLIYYTKKAFNMSFLVLLIKMLEKFINHIKRKKNQLFDETWAIRFLKPDVFIDVGAGA